MLPRTLVSYTRGGLGNRMRALLGALVVAKLQNRRFFYVWEVNGQFAAPITALWSFPHLRANTYLADLAHRLGVRRYDESLQDLDTVNLQRHIQISTAREMRHPVLKEGWREELRALTPVEDVAKRVQETWEKLDRHPYVGVMIRAHAKTHEKTKQRSPVDWYLGRMEEIATLCPDISFFLSTDSPEAQALVRQRFDRVIVQEDKGQYNSLTGLQAAVADLYLLASSAYMLKPYWSSFPAMAQALAGPLLRYEDSETPKSSPIPLGQVPMPSDPMRPSFRDWSKPRVEVSPKEVR
jgi:hypothetical protein